MKNLVLFKRINNLTILKKIQIFCSSNRLQTAKFISTYNQEYTRSLSNPEEYWNEKKNLIEWINEPTSILDRSNSPFEKWYPNGLLNASYNCLDVHVKNGHGDQTALIHDSPLTSIVKKITYQELLNEVNFFKNIFCS